MAKTTRSNTDIHYRGGAVRGSDEGAAVRAFAPLGWLKTLAVAGGWFGGIARRSADPSPQAGQLGGQGGVLGAQMLILLPKNQNLLVLLLVVDDQLKEISPHTHRSGRPIRFCDPGWRRGSNRRRSFPEMQLGIQSLSRVKRGQCSRRAVPTREHGLTSNCWTRHSHHSERFRCAAHHHLVPDSIDAERYILLLG